jgi:membrane-associated phospholipid phosphatase
VPLHEKDVLDAEKWLFGGVEPTVWLQQHLYHPPHVYWYDVFCTLVYTSHFLATPVLAAVLWLRDRRQWLRYISRVVVLAVAGLITYCVFPEAPPWLAAQDGLSPAVGRLSARGWIALHASNVNQALANAQKDGSNPVAAMPSLHTAFAVMVAIAIGWRFRSRWRWLLVLYPMAMGFTLVYCGEHYVLDLLAGALYAVVVHLGLTAWERRRARKRAGTKEPPARVEGGESAARMSDL